MSDIETRPRRSRCDNCVHYAALQSQCRAEPPKTFPLMTQQGLQFLSTFPSVKPEEWCGAHERELDIS